MTNMKTDFVLGVDLDGVCADYENAFRNCVAEQLGGDPSSIPPQTDWDFFLSEGWGIKDRDHFLALHHEAVLHQHLFRDMAVVEGASEALWELSNAGVWIRIVTNRLVVNFAHAKTVSDTVVWLDDHHLPYLDLCLVADKPAVGANLYVDDSPPQVEALMGGGNEVLIFDRAYNRHVSGERVMGWGEVGDKVMARLDDHLAGRSAD